MIDALYRLPVWMLAADEGGTNPISIDPDLAIWTAIVFTILVLVLWRFAWGPISAGLEKREKSINDQIDEAKQAAEKATQTLQQYEAKLAAAAEEANRILTEARQEAERAKEKVITEARETAERERQRAIADIRAAKDQAVRDLAQKSVDSAIALAGNMVRKELNADTHSQLIEESLSRFGSDN